MPALRPRTAPPHVLGVLAGLSLFTPACVSPHMVHMENVDARPRDPTGPGWKGAAAAVLMRYEEAPVLSPDDPRFEPLFGGIATFAAVGTDLDQKLRDQQIPHAGPEWGAPLETACPTEPIHLDAQEQAGTDTTEEQPAKTGQRAAPGSGGPSLRPVWLPMSIDGSALPAAATCGQHGGPHGGADHLCLFGRLSPGEPGRPLILVAHGMFDSSAQDYVHQIAEGLHAMGYGSLLLDMRDHGNTFRAAPAVPISLGPMEGADLLAAARQVRAACPGVTRVGALGVSAGGLAVVSAYAQDGTAGPPALDAGALALSPLLDVDATLTALENGGPCSVAQVVELTWQEHLLLTLSGGLGTAGGAAMVKSLNDQALDGDVAIAAGVGAASALATGLLTDWLFDGRSVTNDDCVMRAGVGSLFRDLVRARWRTLQAVGPRSGVAADVLATPATEVDLGLYLEARTDTFYPRRGRTLRRAEAGQLAEALRGRSQRTQGRGRLLVLSAQDDPVIPSEAQADLASRVNQLPDVWVAAVTHGGHGGMSIVHEPLMRTLIDRVFSHPSTPAPPPELDAATRPAASAR